MRGLILNEEVIHVGQDTTGVNDGFVRVKGVMGWSARGISVFVIVMIVFVIVFVWSPRDPVA